MIVLRMLLVLLVLPLSAAGDEFQLPNPPAGQVLDQPKWLSRESKVNLENELARLRQSHEVDVLVVIWKHAVPTGMDPEQLARQLGKTWSREDLWALVLHLPETINTPFVAWGGQVLENIAGIPSAPAIDAAVARGLKEWTEQERVASVSLNLGEELVFLQHRRAGEDKVRQQQIATTQTEATQEGRTLFIRIALIILGIFTAAAIAAAAVVWRRIRSRPATFHFPQTRWQRRLGASWSGGSKLITSFTPPKGD
jgi:uncharacterized membrane protein YgcG